MLTKRDYTTSYSMKDLALNVIAPKYLNTNEISLNNIGIFGYVTDLSANTTEDTTNIISAYRKEIFPNLAELPESIYTYAGLYNIDDIFAKPSTVNCMIFVNQNDIFRFGEVKDGQYYFYIDSDTVVDVEGNKYILDYDILITCKSVRGTYVFSAKYDIGYENSVSDIKNPFIKTKSMSISNNNYLALMVSLRKVEVTEINETIISNDKINFTKISFKYNNQLAGFDVMYREPGKNEYVQLKKRLSYTTPIRDPFCFYDMVNEDTVELSFTTKDSYFKPEFNSDLLIRIYTTDGASGNRPLYEGNKVVVVPSSEKYIYNQSLNMFAVIQTASTGGYNSSTLEIIKERYLEKMVTVDSYTTNNDLQVYFNSIRRQTGNEITFVKKRDDVFERLFSAFLIMRDMYGEIYHTNTLNIDLLESNLIEMTNNTSIIPPGKRFVYTDGSLDVVKMCDEVTDEEFVYTLPFLVYIQSSPENIGFYINSINEHYELEYTYLNPSSFMQFICNSIHVYRNATKGEDKFKLRVTITPAVEDYNPIVDEDGNDLLRVKIKSEITSKFDVKICLVDFNLVDFDLEKSTYTYEAELKTDDFLNLKDEFKVIDVIDIKTGDLIETYIPMTDNRFNLLTFYRYDDVNIGHQFDHLEELKDYTLTNIYSAYGDKSIQFIKPIPNIRSRLLYLPNQDGYKLYLKGIPFIESNVVNDTERFDYFIKSLNAQYINIQSKLESIITNFSIDTKFYNTYGKSKHFLIGNAGEKLDKVNCNIRFRVFPKLGISDEVKLVSDIKEYIKQYIENINEGLNSIYISTLIQELHNNINGIEYMTFISINGFDPMVQVIESEAKDINNLSTEEIKEFVPELLSISLDDIHIELSNDLIKPNNRLKVKRGDD